MIDAVKANSTLNLPRTEARDLLSPAGHWNKLQRSVLLTNKRKKIKDKLYFWSVFGYQCTGQPVQ